MEVCNSWSDVISIEFGSSIRIHTHTEKQSGIDIHFIYSNSICHHSHILKPFPGMIFESQRVLSRVSVVFRRGYVAWFLLAGFSGSACLSAVLRANLSARYIPVICLGVRAWFFSAIRVAVSKPFQLIRPPMRKKTQPFHVKCAITSD